MKKAHTFFLAVMAVIALVLFTTGIASALDFPDLGHNSSQLNITPLYIDDINQRIGIGTPNPSAKLEVAGWYGRTAHNNGGLVGSYNNVAPNSARSNPIYAIGSNYQPADSDLGNMFGIGYTHTNAVFITDPGPNSWGMYVASDGDARIWLASSAGGHSYFNTGGNVGIGTTTPSTRLHVNPEIADDASRVYDANALMVVHQTPTSNAALNDPEEVLYLGRQGTSGEAYGAMATFKLSRYDDWFTDSNTRLDIDLTQSNFNDNNVMTLLSDGRVGISTTNPQADLHVDRYGMLYLNNELGTDPKIYLSTGFPDWFIGNDVSSSDDFYIQGNSGAADQFLTIRQNGNVGIGKTDPIFPLDVESSIASNIAAFTSTTNRANIRVADEDTTFYIGAENGVGFLSMTGGALGSANIAIDSSGDVGIGTTNPSERLHVAGNAAATNFLASNGVGIGTQWISNSAYGFSNGILITTDIAEGDNRMIELYIDGNSYSGWGPISGKVQAYNYVTSDDIIQRSYTAYGRVPSEVRIFRHNGYIKFWMPQNNNYQTYRFRLGTNTGTHSITNIQNSAMPGSGVTKEYVLTPKTVLDNRVGIGTTDPISSLDVRRANPDTWNKPTLGVSDVNDGFLMLFGNAAGSGPAVIWDSDDRLRFGTGGSSMADPDSAWDEKMTILSDGKVGIGITDPGEELEVDGNINVTAGNDVCIDEGACLSSESRCEVIRPYDPAEGDAWIGREVLSMPSYCMSGQPCYIILSIRNSGSVTHISGTTYFQAANGNWMSEGMGMSTNNVYNGDAGMSVIASVGIANCRMFDDYAGNENDPDKWVFYDSGVGYSCEAIACRL